MFQACSQLPALCRTRLANRRSGYARKAIFGISGVVDRKGDVVTMKLELEALSVQQLCRLVDGDPLPHEDRVQSRPATSVEALYRAQAPRLLRFFSRRAECQDARDLVQETFLRFAHADDRRVAPLDQPEAYLSQVATNLLRNRARAAFQRTIASPEPVMDDVVDATDMTAMLEARDMLNRVQSAMLRLSPKTREIFMAHRLDGATYAEIGARTDLSVKGVEWHMTKAIAHLHRALAGSR